jgi:PilZ domain
MPTVSHSVFHDDRRGEPRVPAAFPAALGAGHLRCRGRVVDASEHGMLVELVEPLLWDAHEVTLTLGLPASEPWTVTAVAVRRCAGAHSRERIALRLTESRTAARPRRPPSEREVASLTELCTRAYEIAAQDPGAPVPAVLERALLSRDPRARRPADARALVAAIARLVDDYSPDQPR